MINRDINELYYGISIIVRRGKGVARLGKEVLFEESGSDHEAIRRNLQLWIDRYRSARFRRESDVPVAEEPLRGLMQLPPEFGHEVIRQLEDHQRAWDCSCYVRFGLLGVVSEGRPGKPNYQIESSDGLHKQTLRYSHTNFETDDGKFKDENISCPFAKDDLRALWLLYKLR